MIVVVMEFTEREKVDDPFTEFFNAIYRSGMSEEKLTKLLKFGVINLLLSCDPDEIDLERLRQILNPPPPVYPVLYVMAQGRTIEEALREGKHNFVNPDVNQLNFPTSTGPFEGEVRIEPFKGHVSSSEKINSLTIRGFRPLSSLELLNYAVAYKNMQREYNIVALGDPWTDANDKKWVVVVGSDGGERVVYLASYDGEWSDKYFCAYVKK